MRNGRISVMATTAPSDWRTATRTTIRAVAVSSCPLEVADSENVGDLGPAAATAVTAAVPTRLVGRGVGRPARHQRPDRPPRCGAAPRPRLPGARDPGYRRRLPARRGRGPA